MKDAKTTARENVARLTRKRTAAIIEIDLQLSQAVREALASGNKYRDLYAAAGVHNDAELWRLILPTDPVRGIEPDDPHWDNFYGAARRFGVSRHIMTTLARNGQVELGYTTRGRKVVRIS